MKNKITSLLLATLLIAMFYQLNQKQTLRLPLRLQKLKIFKFITDKSTRILKNEK